MNINILHEDNDIIVCEKPAGVLSQSDRSVDSDMVNILKNYIYEKNSYNNEPFVGLVHRLDRPVGGIMVFAKNQIALKRLNEQVQNKKLKKFYLAVCENKSGKEIFVYENSVRLIDYLVKDQKTNLSRISNTKGKNAKRSELLYKVLSIKKDLVLIEVELITGRHHQIRVQMSGQDLPLWGDTKYNTDFLERHSDMKWADVALYAYKLEFMHPITKKKMKFEQKPIKYPLCEF